MAEGSRIKEAASFRLSPDLMEELKRRARESGVTTTALVERYLDEGLRHETHPLIVFREGAGGRRPALAGTRLDVAQVIETIKAAESRGEEAIQEAADYLGIQPAYVLACVTYYADYKDEVDKWREHEHAVSRRAQEAWARGRAVLS